MINLDKKIYYSYNNPLNNICLFNDVLSSDQLLAIKEYSVYLFNTGNMNGNYENRYRKRLIKQAKHPEFITTIIEKFNTLFKNYDCWEDTSSGIFLTYNKPYSFIQPHQDLHLKNGIRFNLIIEKNDFEGNPIINGLLYPRKKNTGWIFSHSNNFHGSTPIEKNIRINLSMGWEFKTEEECKNALISFGTK